jgi:hypothetical protein
MNNCSSYSKINQSNNVLNNNYNNNSYGKMDVRSKIDKNTLLALEGKINPKNGIYFKKQTHHYPTITTQNNSIVSNTMQRNNRY